MTLQYQFADRSTLNVKPKPTDLNGKLTFCAKRQKVCHNLSSATNPPTGSLFAFTSVTLAFLLFPESNDANVKDKVIIAENTRNKIVLVFMWFYFLCE
jgi:hypothetical protein